MPKPKPEKGKCYNCGKPIPEKRRWCCDICRYFYRAERPTIVKPVKR